MKPYHKYLTEMLGTFFMVFAGTGAIVIHDLFGGTITHLGISVVFGLVVLVVIYAFGEVSGAHINPAVTFAFWLSKQFPGKQVTPYVVAQLVGAILASFLLHTMFPSHDTYGATIPKINLGGAFGMEMLLSFFLMTVILFVSEGSKETGLMAGVAIGSTVGLEALFAGPVTGASMNPARSFGPALVSGDLSVIWLYIAAPILGMCVSVVIFNLLKYLKIRTV